MFKDMPIKFIKTFTCDNGKEFTKPYHSWERGTNENTNGLIRQCFTKGYNFENITKEDLALGAHKINHRPRKVLGFRTAHEVFWSEIKERCCN